MTRRNVDPMLAGFRPVPIQDRCLPGRHRLHIVSNTPFGVARFIARQCEDCEYYDERVLTPARETVNVTASPTGDRTAKG